MTAKSEKGRRLQSHFKIGAVSSVLFGCVTKMNGNVGLLRKRIKMNPLNVERSAFGGLLFGGLLMIQPLFPIVISFDCFEDVAVAPTERIACDSTDLGCRINHGRRHRNG